jgi:hypothetical protein
MKQSLDEIAEYAEYIGKRNLTKGKVNLIKIAKKKGISIIYGHYKDCFLGELVHNAKHFYIYVNLDLLPDKKSARARFTIAS